MDNRVVFIAKTDLNTDGRILNQIKILNDFLPNLKIDFILLPDKTTQIDLPENVRLHEIKGAFRGKEILRFFTVFEFTFKALRLLFKIKPVILHAEDSATTLPVIFYKLIKRKSLYLIYDDHELPNSNESLSKKLMDRIENILIKKADKVVLANSERLEYIQQKLNLDRKKLDFFLNLPYFENDNAISAHGYQELIDKIDNQIANGTKFIIHQGPLKRERGREMLADFSMKIPQKFKILLLGGNQAAFDDFIKEYGLNELNFLFVGTVNYLALPHFWAKGIASIVIYLPTYINNKLCAPNRFYLSIENQLPVIVNRDNPVLLNFIINYNAGFFIDEFDDGNLEKLVEFDKMKLKGRFEELKKEQIENFISLYRNYSLC